MPTGTSARKRRRTLSRRSSSRSPSGSSSQSNVGGPPRPLFDDPTALPHEEPTRPDLADTAEGCSRRARAPEREDLVDAGEIGCRADLAGGEEGLCLGAEHEGAVAEQGVVEGPNAEAIADECQPAPRGLPPGERELAVEPIERVDAVPLQQPQHDLGVAGRGEGLTPCSQRRAQLRVVVDLAVVDEDAPVPGSLEGLPAAGQVEDRESRRHEPRARVERESEAVGATMANRPGHPAEGQLVDRLRGVRADDSCEAAHSAGGVDDDRRGVEVLGRDAPSLDLPVGDLHVLGPEAHPI